MGLHYLDLIVILGIALLIFGPKTIQSMARSAGKGVGQAKELKDKALAELPMEEISEISRQVSRIPLSPQQAVQMIVTSELSGKAKDSESVEKLDQAELSVSQEQPE